MQTASQIPWYLPLVGLLGVLLGGLLGFGGTLITQWQQGRRDRLADERKLRDAQYERMHTAYQRLIASLYALADTIEMPSFVDTTHLSAEQEAQIHAAFEDTAVKARESRNAFVLDLGPSAVLERAFELAQRANAEFHAAIAEKSLSPEERKAQLATASESMHRACEMVQRTAREQLVPYTQPLPAPKPPRRK